MSTFSQTPYGQRRLNALPLVGQERALPSDAFVIEALVGDSQAAGFETGLTLLDGIPVAADGGLIWNKWSPGASLGRLDNTDIGTAFVPITANLGTSITDIGPEVTLGATRAKRFRPGRYGLVKCAVSGADVGLPAAGVTSALNPITPGALFEGLIEGHLKPAVRWCYANNLHPYLGAIYLSIGGADSIGAVERAMSFSANLITWARGFATRMGLLRMPLTLVLEVPTDIPSATYTNMDVLRAQYKYIRGRPPFRLLDYSTLLRQADAVHLTAQGQYDLGIMLAESISTLYGELQHVDNF